MGTRGASYLAGVGKRIAFCPPVPQNNSHQLLKINGRETQTDRLTEVLRRFWPFVGPSGDPATVTRRLIVMLVEAIYRDSCGTSTGRRRKELMFANCVVRGWEGGFRNKEARIIAALVRSG